MAFALAPASAARPLLERHQWDAYFALFARDTSIPWKTTTVRLDTYSSAPVELAAYEADPADVIIAGQNGRFRAIETARRKPVTRWRFNPPSGYRFESNDVEVPLQNREGFFVIEARRGDAAQQVWINRTRVGLLTKESPEGLLVYGADLGSGKALRNMRVTFLVGKRFAVRYTDGGGVVRWQGALRPAFALAEYGSSKAFVSILPQAPLPPTVVGVRVESARVRAGERIRAVGFVRRRQNGGYRRASGEALVTLSLRGRQIVAQSAHLDQAGAFVADIGVPASSEAGDYALLVSAAGGTGGTAVAVDATAGELALRVAPLCAPACSAAADIPFAVSAVRAGIGAANLSVNVRVVRTPHIIPPGEPDDAERWGTTTVLEQAVRTDASGVAHFTIPAPADGLSSTYGVRAASGSATASTRLAVSSARVALALEPERDTLEVGQEAAFVVRGFEVADGSPAPGLNVKLRLSHGVASQEQNVRLDSAGKARAAFRSPSLGTSIAVAQAEVDGSPALDATAVTVDPSARVAGGGRRFSDVSISLDRSRYRPGERVGVKAVAPSAQGDALLTLDGARTYADRTIAVNDGTAGATLPLGEPQGDVRAGAAFVHDGALHLGTSALAIDGPGHPRATALSSDKPAYAPGAAARVTIHDGELRREATLIVRLADGLASAGAFFDDAAAVLAAGGTTAQNPSSENPAWHAWVAPSRSRALDAGAPERIRTPRDDDRSIGVAAPRVLLWRVERGDHQVVEVQLPRERGRYVVSILKIVEDGDVGAASLRLIVQ